MPLMLQVGFGYPAIIAGCMIAPTAIGSIIAKSTVTQVLRWFGYRKTLVGITVFIGLMIAQFSLQSPEMLWDASSAAVRAVMAMSTQFTAMNTITLADLTDDNASSGNSSVGRHPAAFQLVSGGHQRCGATLSMKVLIMQARYSSFTTPFITMGVITIISALMFMLLRAADGRNLISERHKR